MSEAPTTRSPALLGATFSAMLWGFGGILAALSTISGVAISMWRLWAAIIIYAMVLALSRRRLSWAILSACVPGGIFLAGEFIMFFSAVKMTSITIVSVVGALQPAVVYFAARRYHGERRPVVDFAWLAAALVGVGIVVVGNSSRGRSTLTGDLLAVGAMILWSAYWMASKSARYRVNSLEYTAGVSMVAAVVVTPIALVIDHGVGSLSTRNLVLILLITIVPGGGHLIMNWAHRYLAASTSSAIGNLSTLVASVAAVPILGQPLSMTQVAGILIALGGVIAIARRQVE
jgi:drug/metabolite transporter (DMT)-like permease